MFPLLARVAEAALAVLLLAANGLGAADEPRERITTLAQFWSVPPEIRQQQALPFEIACTVTFFDPQWHICFIQDETGTGAYVWTEQLPFPPKAGDQLLVRGEFPPPNKVVTFANVEMVRRAAKPPEVPMINDSLTDHPRHANQLVAVEGVVDRMSRSNESHLRLTLAVHGQAVEAWVLMGDNDPTPMLVNQRVRLAGVYNPKFNPAGAFESLEILVASLAKVQALGAAEDEEAFKLPVTPINALPGAAASQPVRVVGTVVAREPGHFVRIRDAGGQVDVMTGQMRPFAMDDAVEAVGYPAVNGVEWRLERGLLRAVAGPAAPVAGPGASGTIKLASDVLKLSAEEAAQGRPVELTGVVVWSASKAPFFFISDSSGGVCIERGGSTSAVRSPGRNVAVRGVTAMGRFAPVVVASSFERVSEGIVPVARQVSIEHALTGGAEAQWVEMRGYLRRIVPQGDWNLLELATATSDFTAMLPRTEDARGMVGAVVRVHGVCTAEADARRKLTGIKLWVPGITYLQVEEPALTDSFAVPARALPTLGQYETVQAFNRRVRVVGTVLHQSPGHSIRLAEGGHSLLVLAREGVHAQPGDQLEAVGFLGRADGRIILREAVYRILGHGPEPVPRTLATPVQPDPTLDGQLVRLDGILLGTAVDGEAARFTVQTPGKILDVSLDSPPRSFTPPPTGSQVRFTGVYELNLDERGNAGAFALRLRSPGDLVLLATPSWWTRSRILAFTGVIALGAVMFLGWVTVLRRQVNRQTGLIRAQMEREARLQGELARAAKLESLGLLAGGIAHDFNNLLTVLIGNISLVQLDGNLAPDAARSLNHAAKAAGRARDLTQQLLTFAKGGAPLRAAVSLPEVVREVAEFAVRGSRVRCEFDLPADLWPASVDKGQIAQVVQNIVINAQQAMPDGGVVQLTLSNQQVDREFAGVLEPGRYVRIDFTDHGPGIATGDIARVFDPYFTTKQQGSGLGLATVHSIVKKHAGHITAESTVDRGTTFRVWLPAAQPGEEIRPTTTPPMAGAGAPAATNGVRVLIMDDEEFIRTLGGSILRRFGYEATAVADGAVAIAEYVRARREGQPYDLVILDLTVPGGMGGRQALEELRRLDPAIKAIVSSGYSNDLVLANHQAHGFRGIISKPYDVAEFAQTVERVLRGQAG